jgi:catechol 2,3-dioxygenase-like lactoylglutathione lyase family enzyme
MKENRRVWSGVQATGLSFSALRTGMTPRLSAGKLGTQREVSMRWHGILLAAVLGLGVGLGAGKLTYQQGERPMELGNFSISLSVKDLAKSMAFYETLGFKKIGGEPKQNWVILQNSTATIGLFQGMFEGNLLTFNPGWDRNSKNTEPFDDVRDLQKRLKAAGIKLTSEAPEDGKGPASFTLADPDGNVILVDQHR